MPVPHKEVPSLLSTQSKGNAITEGMWVRVKTGKYKGDLAQVYNSLSLREVSFAYFDNHLLDLDFLGGGSQ